MTEPSEPGRTGAAHRRPGDVADRGDVPVHRGGEREPAHGRGPVVKAISLFTGIGGFDLGFERAGIETVLQAEQDPHCLGVLARQWASTRRIDDVRLVATAYPFEACPPECEDGCVREPECVGHQEIADEFGTIDVVHGGFPCTDISSAKDRWGAKGLEGEQSGLWSEFARVIAVVRPRWVVIENTGRLRNGRGGADLRAVVGELDRLDYVGVGIVLDAAAFGMPAARPRVVIVAGNARGTGGLECRRRLAAEIASNDPGCVVLEGSRQPRPAHHGPSRPTPGSYRKLTPLECERLQGFPDGWTAGQADSHRYRQLGNAVCVPVAEWIGHRLVAVDAMLGVAS